MFTELSVDQNYTLHDSTGYTESIKIDEEVFLNLKNLKGEQEAYP